MGIRKLHLIKRHIREKKENEDTIFPDIYLLSQKTHMK